MIFDRALSDEEIGNIQAYLNLKYETDLDKVASGISLENPEYPDKGLKLPEMPRGIELAIESSDPEASSERTARLPGRNRKQRSMWYAELPIL